MIGVSSHFIIEEISMKKFFNWLVTLLFPAFIFLSSGRVFFALVALVLQATVAGWIPATIWAYITWTNDLKEEKELQEKTAQPAPASTQAPTASDSQTKTLLSQKPEKKA